MRLGVNIDHVATVREARKTFEPDPVFTALLAQKAGADQITLHLREDRRHVKERDLRLVKELVNLPVNLEMAPVDEIKRIALEVKPDRVTLVPERREEITTEGGLDVINLKEFLSGFITDFKECGIEVSLFIEPEVEHVRISKDIGADAVELHTGRYANLWNEHKFKEVKEELNRLRRSALEGRALGLKVYAGHGLTYNNIKDFISLSDVIEEVNIGHSIVANAVIFGFEEAVRRMKELTEG